MNFIKTLIKSLKYLDKEAEKEQKRFICLGCGYKWITKKKFGKPFQCPKCGWRKIKKVWGEK